MPAAPAVLVVDGYPDAAESLCLCLRADGFDARPASTRAAALGLLAGWAPAAAVLNLRVPGTTGYELADRLCDAVTPRPFLVALTTDARGTERSRAVADGFDAAVGKPADPFELIGLLRRHTARPGPT